MSTWVESPIHGHLGPQLKPELLRPDTCPSQPGLWGFGSDTTPHGRVGQEGDPVRPPHLLGPVCSAVQRGQRAAPGEAMEALGVGHPAVPAPGKGTSSPLLADHRGMRSPGMASPGP